MLYAFHNFLFAAMVSSDRLYYEKRKNNQSIVTKWSECAVNPRVKYLISVTVILIIHAQNCQKVKMDEY